MNKKKTAPHNALFSIDDFMTTIHPTAIIDSGASIGNGTKIWHWAHICGGATIGANCVLGQNVYVANNVIIGNNVRIQNNVSLYDNIILEDDVFCGPSMVFTNVSNPRAHISRKNEYKDTRVKKGATIGANATILCGIVLGEYCFVGAGSVVLYNIPAFALVVGNPARQIGWICQCGERLSIPVDSAAHQVTTCNACQTRYSQRDKQLYFATNTNDR